MTNRLTNMIAGAMLLLMALFSVLGAAGDSATFDEIAHIPAGYSYLTHLDMRLNFEHPPLIKDLAAIPLLFLNLNFPENSIYWNQTVNTSFEFGNEFLYYANKNVDQILFFSRIPMILILMAFGIFLFSFAKKIGGNIFGLAVLTLYVFSPEFLGNGKLVTTDVGAATAIFISFAFFLKFLKLPSLKNSLLNGLFFGIALLVKSSAIILAPFFILILAIWVIVSKDHENLTSIKKLFCFLFLAFFVSFLLLGIVYQIHLINFPLESQVIYTKITLSHPLLKPFGDMKWLVDFCVWASGNAILRPYAFYLLGVLAMTVKTIWGFGALGFPTYFSGEISTKGLWYYFPAVYLIKLPLSFHIMGIIALFYGIKKIAKNGTQEIKNFISKNFTELSMALLVMMYFSVMMSGNMNLGIRHLIPIIPFLYILILKGIWGWIDSSKKMALLKKISVGILFCWYISSSVFTSPHFLTYFNELAGGPSGGSRYVVDSNLDWGQDLKRLKTWVDDNNIEKIKIDYFGGGNVEYYFKNKYEKFDPKSGPQKGWLAISATLLRGGQGKPAKGFLKSASYPTEYYNWLEKYKPLKIVGNSIFIYYID